MNRTRLEQTFVEMAVIFAAALPLGLAYNITSPLGVRLQSSASSIVASTPAAPEPGGGAGELYRNETVVYSLEAEGAPPPSVAGPIPIPAPAPAPMPDAPIVPIAPTLTWAETRKLLAAGQIVLVDARMAVYFQAEHIPGAVSFPPNATPEEMSAFAAKYPKSADIVVYCASAQCPLSNQLVAVLTGRLGYTHVREMPGGFVEYRDTESQLAKGTR